MDGEEQNNAMHERAYVGGHEGGNVVAVHDRFQKV